MGARSKTRSLIGEYFKSTRELHFERRSLQIIHKVKVKLKDRGFGKKSISQ